MVGDSMFIKVKWERRERIVVTCAEKRLASLDSSVGAEMFFVRNALIQICTSVHLILPGTDYTLELDKAHDEMKRMNELTSHPAVMMLRIFKENITGEIAGFDLDPQKGSDEYPPYDSTTDPLVSRLDKTVNKERALLIYTYGTRYVFKDPDDVERCFNAAELRGQRNNMLTKLRGTDPVLMQTVRVIPEFPSFIKGVVRDIEKNDLHCVSIICRGGHHRSVAAAEWLRLLYPKVEIEHMTINQ